MVNNFTLTIIHVCIAMIVLFTITNLRHDPFKCSRSDYHTSFVDDDDQDGLLTFIDSLYIKPRFHFIYREKDIPNGSERHAIDQMPF